MSSIHDCDLIEEDLLLWQMLDPTIMAVSFSLHWVVQMNLITSTRSLERSATQSSLSLSLLEACICFSIIEGSCGVVCVRYVWNYFTSFWAACILSALLEMFLWVVAIIIYFLLFFFWKEVLCFLLNHPLLEIW